MINATEEVVRAARMSAITNEELVLRITDLVGGVNQSLAELKPLIQEAYRRLEDGQTVHGCTTKKEFSEKVLGKTDRTVRYMLAGGNHNRTEYVPASSIPTPETVSAPSDALTKGLGWAKDRVEAAAEFSAQQHEAAVEPKLSKTKQLRAWIQSKYNASQLRPSETDNFGGKKLITMGRYDLTLYSLTPRLVKQIGELLANDHPNEMNVLSIEAPKVEFPETVGEGAAA